MGHFKWMSRYRRQLASSYTCMGLFLTCTVPIYCFKKSMMGPESGQSRIHPPNPPASDVDTRAQQQRSSVDEPSGPTNRCIVPTARAMLEGVGVATFRCSFISETIIEAMESPTSA